MGEAPSEIAVGPSFLAKLTMAGPRRARIPNRMVLGSYVQPMEWDRPSTDTLALGPKVAQSIIDHWDPFNKRESLVTHIRNLYPTLLRVPVAARVEEYSIPFLGYLDRKSFQHVAKDGILIRNHDFNESAELTCFDL